MGSTMSGSAGESADASLQPGPNQPAPAPARVSAIWRRIGWVFLGFAVLVVAVIGAALLVLANLDNPTIAGQIKKTLAEDFGLGVDYEELSVQVFSGLHARGLRVRTPDPYAAHAPELLHIERLDVKWAVWPSLVEQPRVAAIELVGVKLRLVTDEHGGSSLAELTKGFASPAPAEPEPEAADASPLSHLVQEALPGLVIESLAVNDVAVELVDVRDNVVVRRVALASVCLNGPIATGQGTLDVALRLDSCTGNEGLKLTVDEHPGTPQERNQELVAGLDIAVNTPSPQSVEVVLGSNLVRQNLVDAEVLPPQLMRARVNVTFDPQQGQTRVRLQELDLLQGGVTADLTAALHDRPQGSIAPVVERLQGGVVAERMKRLLSFVYGQLDLTQATVEYEVTDLTVDPETGMLANGDVRLHVDIPGAGIDQDGQRVALGATTLDVKAQFREAADSFVDTKLRVDRLDMEQASGERVSLKGLSVAVQGRELRLNLDNPIFSRGAIALRTELDDVSGRFGDSRADVRNLKLETEIPLSGTPALAVKGTLPVERLSFAQGQGKGKRRVQIDGISVAWDMRDLSPGFAIPATGEITVGLTSGKLNDNGQVVEFANAGVGLNAVVKDLDHFDARIDIPVPELKVRSPDGLNLTMREATLGVEAQDFELNQTAPEKSQGRISVTTRLPRVVVRTPDMRATGDQLEFSTAVVLAGTKPMQVSGALPLGRLQVRDRKAQTDLLRLANGKLSWQLTDIVLHPDDPMRTRAKARVEGSFPDVALPGAGVAVDVPSTRIEAVIRGPRRAYDAKLRLALRSFVVDGKRHRPNLVTNLSARANLRQPRAQIRLALKGPRGPEVTGKLDARYQAAQRNLVYDVNFRGQRLDLVGDLLPASVREAHEVDWSTLRFRLASNGAVKDVIRRLQDGTTPIIADDPLAVMRGQQHLEVDVEGLDYRAPGQAVNMPRLTIRFDGSENAGPMEADLQVRSERIQVLNGDQPIEIIGFAEHLTLSSSGSPEQGRLALQSTTELERVTQEMVGYPLEKARLVVRGHSDRLSAMRVEEFLFTNPAGGTQLRAEATVDRPATAVGTDDTAIPGRQALAMTGSLEQDLSRVSVIKNAPPMRGRIELPFQVESGDLSAFVLRTRARIEDVYASLPESEIAVEGFNGDIPVTVDIALLPDGTVQLLSGPSKNLYSRTRFLDVHPFLRGQHFLSIDRVALLGQTIGPIAGNLRVERDTLALDQLQLGFLDGTITGQVLVDYQGGRPRLQFKGNGTGIRPTQGEEVVDANANLNFVPDQLALDGRIQIIRISQEHLLKVLNVLDPYREDTNINLARKGLKVGYPKFFRLLMKDGFVSGRLELGGIAGAAPIVNEFRGIALGPLLNRYVAPYLNQGALP